MHMCHHISLPLIHLPHKTAAITFDIIKQCCDSNTYAIYTHSVQNACLVNIVNITLLESCFP